MDTAEIQKRFNEVLLNGEVLDSTHVYHPYVPEQRIYEDTVIAIACQYPTDALSISSLLTELGTTLFWVRHGKPKGEHRCTSQWREEDQMYKDRQPTCCAFNLMVTVLFWGKRHIRAQCEAWIGPPENIPLFSCGLIFSDYCSFSESAENLTQKELARS